VVTAARLQFALAEMSRFIELILVVACSALLVLLTVNVFIEVLIRYVLNATLSWTEEIARFALVWFAMLASGVAARRGVHFAFRWGMTPFPESIRRPVRQLVNVLVIAFLSVVVVQGIGTLNVVSDQTSMATEIDMRIPYAGIPVGMGLVLVIYVLEVADAILSHWTHRQLSIKEAHDLEILQVIEAVEHVPPTLPVDISRGVP
jgi:TRAP-type C4-dicarboxylate transport system permease small subunit